MRTIRKIKDYISATKYIILISSAALILLPIGLLAFFTANGVYPAHPEDEEDPAE